MTSEKKQQQAKVKLLKLTQLTKDVVLDNESLVPTKQPTYSDWRLPTITELLTLVDYTKYEPASSILGIKSSFYWSSTVYASCARYAWNIYFISGSTNIDEKRYKLYVRCVRDGETGLEWSATSDNRMTWNEAIDYASNLTAPVYYKEQ